MKKYLKLLFVALFATLSFALVSCGDDDDDDNNALVGSWAVYYQEGSWAAYGEVTFTKEGRFTMTDTETYGSEVSTYTVAGTYSVNGDLKTGAMLAMSGVDSDGDEVEAVVVARVDGDKLYITDEDEGTQEFTRK